MLTDLPPNNPPIHNSPPTPPPLPPHPPPLNEQPELPTIRTDGDDLRPVGAVLC
jgi:hypothetical protein